MRQTTLTPEGATDALRAAHAASALTLPLNQDGGGGADAVEVTDDGTGGVFGDAGGAVGNDEQADKAPLDGVEAADTAPRDGDGPGVVPADTVVGDSSGDGAPVPTPTAAEKRTVSPRQRLRSAATVKVWTYCVLRCVCWILSCLTVSHCTGLPFATSHCISVQLATRQFQSWVQLLYHMLTVTHAHDRLVVFTSLHV